MKLDRIISKISAIIAACVVFVFTCGMYLQFKGFNFDKATGEFVLINSANAKGPFVEVGSNVVLPEGREIGDKNAPAKIYVFSSYGCFACAKMHLTTLLEIKKVYVDTGKAQLIFVDYPLDINSMQASVLAGCVSDEDYLNFADELFLEQRSWSRGRNAQDKLISYAMKNGLSEKQAKECLADKKNAEKILEQRQDAMANLKVMATPSILVVKGDNRRMYEGALNFGILSQILNKN